MEGGVGVISIGVEMGSGWVASGSYVIRMRDANENGMDESMKLLIFSKAWENFRVVICIGRIESVRSL